MKFAAASRRADRSPDTEHVRSSVADGGREAERVRWRRRFRDGVIGVLPLMVGVVPFALVFGMSARAGGWSVIETQALSMLLFAGSAQLAVLSLAAGGAAGAAIVVVVALLNLRHVLYGMALARWLPRDEPPPRPLLAALVTDESFGLATREAVAGRPSAAFLWGSSVTLYVLFAIFTLAGALLGDRIPDPTGLGLDIVFPLTFLALLLVVVRGWRDWLVAALSGGLVVALRQVLDGGTALLGATVAAAAIGALLLGDSGGPARQSDAPGLDVDPDYPEDRRAPVRNAGAAPRPEPGTIPSAAAFPRDRSETDSGRG